MTPIICDCTLRDGGYCNNWQFDLNLVNKYLHILDDSKIPAIEIGFRSPLDKIKGITSHITDSFIKENLFIPKSYLKYFGVMINASDFNQELVRQLFVNSDESPINLVRVATHFKDIDKVESICKQLKYFGYFVTINLMQAADKSYDEIRQASETIQKWYCIDVLYLADSFGGMNSDLVDYAFKAIRDGWDGLIGFHAHNNKGQALINTLESVDIGINFVDSTISGMGRGAGNCETEYLLYELNKRGFGEYDLNGIFDLVINDFYPMKEKFKWESNILYYLSSDWKIHPTYVQTMIERKYSNDFILHAIHYLKNKKSSSFNEKLLTESIEWQI